MFRRRKAPDIRSVFLAAPLALAFAAIPDAMAQDMSRHPICASYARHAANYDREAFSRGCKVKTIRGNLNGNEGAYYTFCMRTSDAEFRGRSPVAGGHKVILMRECTRQLRYEFPL